MEIKLNVKTNGELTNSKKELLIANIWSLVNEVRPDLVNQNLDTEIECIEVTSFNMK